MKESDPKAHARNWWSHGQGMTHCDSRHNCEERTLWGSHKGSSHLGPMKDRTVCVPAAGGWAGTPGLQPPPPGPARCLRSTRTLQLASRTGSNPRGKSRATHAKDPANPQTHPLQMNQPGLTRPDPISHL